MLIRHQVPIALAVVIVLAAACLVEMELARRGAVRHLQGRQDAQRVTHQAGALLASTHQFTLFPGPGTAVQWRARLAELSAAVDDAQRHWQGRALAPLASSLGGLEPLFALLVDAELRDDAGARNDLDVQSRRKALLVERLIVETQSAAEVANRWSFDLDARMAGELRHHTLAALALQATLVLAIVLSAWRLMRLFTGRIARLHRAAEALRGGRLDHRVDDRRDDEIGGVARALDAAAAALRSQQGALVDANRQLGEQVRDRERSERRLRLVFDALPAQVGYWDADGCNRLANRDLEQAAGVGHGGLVGRRYDEAGGGDRVERAGWQTLVQRGETVTVEHAAGQQRLQTILVPERDGDGSVVGFLSHTMDVTEQRRLESRIAESERFLAALTDRVPLQLGYIDAAGALRFANAAWVDAAAAPRAALLGRHWSDALAPQRAEAIAPLVQSALAGTAGRIERDEPAAAGARPRVVEYLLVPGTAVDGGGCYWIGADVTERRRGEQLLSQIAALAPSGMLLVGDDGRIRFANAEAARIFGYDAGELTGMPLLSLLPAEHRNVHRQLQQRFFDRPVDRPIWVRSDLFGLHRDGTRLPLEIGLSAVDTADGIAALALVLDVGERRAQQARLETALAARETLLREFHHRVKNNLQMVHSLLRMQLRLLPVGSARSALDDTALRVRAMALVHEQLHVGESEQQVMLAAYTAELLRLASEAAGAPARGIALRADVAPLRVPIERAVSYGLLVNELVANALKHGYDGAVGGAVVVRVTIVADGVPRLEVSDDGSGLPAGFDIGEQRSMGLQLAAALAGQLGGTLKVEPGGADGRAGRHPAFFSADLPALARDAAQPGGLPAPSPSPSPDAEETR